DSHFSKVKGYEFDDRGSIHIIGKDFWFHRVQTSSEVYPASHTMGTGALFLVVKRQGHDADHSPPSSVEVKNGGAILLIPHTSSWHSA
ncbi:hypothetical protein B7P43_G04954, partial [Cryptotermes secundus]